MDNNLLRSTAVTELISRKPSFLVRWGVTLLFLFAVVLLATTWFIRYPDIVTANGILNSINAPKEIVARTTGKLSGLLVKENEEVEKGQVLGFMESTASYTEVNDLSGLLANISEAMDHNKANVIVNRMTTRYDNLGELQSSYQVFSQGWQQFTNYLQQGFYIRKKKMLEDDLAYLQRMHTEQLQQQKLLQQDLLLADSTFVAQESLRNDKVISPMDYRNEKSKLIAKQMTLQQAYTSIISNESLQHEKQKETAELENQIAQQKSLFVQALNTIKSQVEDWKKKYLVTAPEKGRVSFMGFLQENQELKSGQLICYINPGNAKYYAEAVVHQFNFGKIKTGQEVLLKFPAYPYTEFGAVKGRIEFISAVPTDSGYVAKISLVNGLVTNYQRTIQYRTGLVAQADIITEDLRLAERFMNNLRKQVSRSNQ